MTIQVVSGTVGRLSGASDGVDWDVYSSGDGYDFVNVHHNGTLWMAVSREGTVLISGDGITWVGATTPIDYSWNDVDYGGSGVWCLVGGGAALQVFPNPSNSEGLVTVDPDVFLVGSEYPNLLAVYMRKVGGSCTWYAAGNNGYIWRTTDKTGETGWESVFEGSNLLRDITSNPNDGTVYACGASNTVVYSTNNGDTWTAVGGDLDSLTQRTMFAMAYSPELGVWVGTTSTNRLYFSQDWASGVVEEVTVGTALWRGADWSSELSMFVLGAASNGQMIAAVDASNIPAVFTGATILASVTVGSVTLNFYEAEPPFEAGSGKCVAGRGVAKECACEAYGPATPGDMTKVGRHREPLALGKTAGPGLYMATEHTDTMWCRRTQVQGPVEG